LKQVRGQPKAGFTAAAGAYDTAIQVSGVGGVCRASVNGEKLGSGQYDIVLKFGVDKGLDVFFRSPNGPRRILHPIETFPPFSPCPTPPSE
jgi:hypothetical protein